MNKTVVFILLIAVQTLQAQQKFDDYGAMIRSDHNTKTIYLCFTGHDFKEGFDHVLKELNDREIQASFFLTGYFIAQNIDLVKRIKSEGHYIGAHSDAHLLYNDWSKRDSLLHSPEEIKMDIANNVDKL